MGKKLRGWLPAAAVTLALVVLVGLLARSGPAEAETFEEFLGMVSLDRSGDVAASLQSRPEWTAARFEDQAWIRKWPEGVPRIVDLGPPGWTALHVAAHFDSARSAVVLVDHGADVNAAGYAGMTPLHLASKYGRTDVARILLDRGADPALRNAGKQTALELAKTKGHVAIVAMLRDVQGEDR